MDIKMFKQQETRRSVKAKSGNKNINIQIVNYTDDLYEKWKHIISNAYESGGEEFTLSDEDLNMLFDDFTNINMTVDELNGILENPNHTFKTIFKELQLILNEMIVRFLQDKQFEIVSTRRMVEETNVLIESGKLDDAIKNLSNNSEALESLDGESK